MYERLLWVSEKREELEIEVYRPYALYTYGEFVIQDCADGSTGGTCWVTKPKWLPIDKAA